MFQFSCRFAFLSTFRHSNRTPKITQILTVYQANVATLTPLSKEDKILIKSLQECNGYNAWQFITKFLNKVWTKNSINRLLVKFVTVDRPSGQRQTQSAYWWKRRHTWVAVAESGRQTSEPPNSQRNFTWEGGSIDHQFCRLFTKICISSCCKKGARSTADWSTQHVRVIFGMQFERR